MLIQVIPRLNTQKSTPTLLDICDILGAVLPSLSSDTDITSSRQILAAVCDLVTASWDWVQATTDKGGEQRVSIYISLF